ncbi:IS630 family transposase, partial [Streptomyces sp. NPDC057910]|uniref:IS630 family transposase n=1 Tax=Streptomyces sp. NPDC057910 TaxID=3346278 RepID=UPI0036E0A06F
MSDEDRRVLERRVRAHKTPQRGVRRARIVLGLAGGASVRRLARDLGMDEKTVARWRDRFMALGLAGLEDRPRPGRPPVYGPEIRLRIVAAATSLPPTPHGSWSHELIAAELADTGISAAQVGRVLASLELKPHRVRGWLTRPEDSLFFEKAAEICALYRSCPAGAVVVSMDEKTAMSARSRKHPDRPTAPRRVRRREFEYVRHGTVSITAALDVHTGQVIAEELPRNTSANSTAFLARLDRLVDPALTVHLVLDNGSLTVDQAEAVMHTLPAQPAPVDALDVLSGFRV